MNQVAQQQSDSAMSVQTDGDFALNLWTLIASKKPTKIIETGTYMATGTTAVIASALDDLIASKQLAVESVSFITIEANGEAVGIARANLRESNFDLFTTVYHGLSIPRHLLPTSAEIKAWTVDTVKDLPINVDHDESDRVYRYFAETDVGDGVEDNMLGKALKRCDWKPDLVLLDSGGSIGLQEFEYLIGNLEGPCYIALDDVFHVKHYRSLQIMLSDPRFDVRVVSRERYGFAIAEFTP